MQQRGTPKAQGSYFPGANAQVNALSNQMRGLARNLGVGDAFGPGQGLLPPNQNPAYQAALQRPRPATTNYTNPSGGTIGVAAGSRLPSGYAQLQGQPTGNISTPESRSAVNAAPPYTNYPQDYAKGYGAPSYPSQQQPLTPGQFITNAITAPYRYAASGFGTLGQNVYNYFSGSGGGNNNQPYMPATNAMTQANSLAANPFIGPTPFGLRPPRRYFDDQTY